MGRQLAVDAREKNTLKRAFELTFYSWARAIAVLSIAGGVIAVAAVDTVKPSAPVCQPDTSNNFCAPVEDPTVKKLISALEAKGLECSSTSALTDTIVFQYREDESVKVVTFDKALKLGKSGDGWVQAFCK